MEKKGRSRKWYMKEKRDIFFFQAEGGIRDFCLSRGLGDVYKRQPVAAPALALASAPAPAAAPAACLLYTSDAADDLLCVDLGGRRIITKKTELSSVPSISTYSLPSLSSSSSILIPFCASRFSYPPSS